MSAIIEQYLHEYNENRIMQGQLKKRQDELSKLIKEHAVNHGNKDSNGSYYSESNRFIFGNQAKKSVTLNQERAKAFFLGIGLYEKVVKIQETVDEDKVEQLIANGDLAPDELEALVDIKVSYAVSVKEKEDVEEMPEVQVQTSTKPRVRKKFAPMKKK